MSKLPRRKISRSAVRFVLIAMIAICGVRALLPPGFMFATPAIGAEQSKIQIVFCTHAGPQTGTLDFGEPDGDDPQKQRGDAPCLYSLSSILAPPAAISSVLPTHLLWVEQKLIAQVREFQIRFEFGPAVGSRAPPFFA